jgi:ComF family protein
MTSILEKTISIIAPHHCILCGNEDNVLCEACFADVYDEPYELCFLCNIPSLDSRVCPACAHKTPLEYVWMAGAYNGPRQKLIKSFKFGRQKAAYVPLAEAMSRTLPYLEDVVVVPIPTAPTRARMRGYDHTFLLARAIARKHDWKLASALRRRHNERQVGASRAVRARQASTAYEVRNTKTIVGKCVLLVDDVTTSGATLNAAATLLAAAGAAEVGAVVAAKHTIK